MDGEIEMLRAVGDQHGILAKTIHHRVHHALVEAHFYLDGITGKHLEQLVRVFRQCVSGQFGAGDPLVLADRDIGHTVHTEMGHTVALGPGQQIAVIVILAQTVGTGAVFLFPEFPFAAEVPVKIPEGDLTVLGHGFLDGIYIVVDGFVHALDPPGNQNIFYTDIIDQNITNYSQDRTRN